MREEGKGGWRVESEGLPPRGVALCILFRRELVLFCLSRGSVKRTDGGSVWHEGGKDPVDRRLGHLPDKSGER